MSLSIVYWNVGRSYDNPILVVEDTEEYDIIAIQEPAQCKGTGRFYNPSRGRYRLVYSGKGRSGIYIHRRHNITTWEQEAGEDWCKVQFGTGEDAITIWAIYSPCEAPEWRSPLQRLVREAPKGRQIIIGDLNTHHPSWDREGRTSPHAGTLLSLAERWNLTLATPWGEPTRPRRGAGECDGTIDHAWHSETLPVRYIGPLDYAGSDHSAQLIMVPWQQSLGAELGAQNQRSTSEELAWSWKLMDRSIVEAEARYINTPAETTLRSPEDLDQAVDELLATLQRIADVSTPRRKESNRTGQPWWSLKVQEAVQEASRAHRYYRVVPSPHTLKELQAAVQRQRKTISEARTQSWRQVLASGNPQALWRLQRWARLRSSAPVEPPKMPPLRYEDGKEGLACTHPEKAAALASRFFPTSEADLTDIQDTTWEEATSQQRFEIKREVTQEEVEERLRWGPWKAPGPDDALPVGFLRACGESLAKALAAIAQASLTLEYFPQRFRNAGVVVLKKPGKTTEQLRAPGGWRPISLLSTLGKVIEGIIGTRIADAAEAQRLLPEGQMGNRKGRSTELAIRLVTSCVQTAWQEGAVASLLQLDIKGAFDTVNHTRLLDTVRSQGFPMWVVRWLNSYLSARTARLRFDGEASTLLRVPAGVPQGSPLSPILFQLYITSLYEALQTKTYVTTIGFADDTNLVVAGYNIASNCQRLEGAFRVCEQWARTRGMQFAPEKSELIHFTQRHTYPGQGVQLGGKLIQPVESARFLGVWLDRKLRWGRHLKEVKKKLVTQKLALTRLAASVWGCSLVQAREIYTKVIRACIAYGAPAWHQGGADGPKGLARKLTPSQNDCLRIVAGAYKATPSRHLEVETATPPLDLYLSKRVTDFELRLQVSGLKQGIENACKEIQGQLKRRRRRGRPRHTAYIAPQESWAINWAGGDSSDKAVTRDWKRRWDAGVVEATLHRGGYREPADQEFPQGKKALAKHHSLRKHESSLLIQARTGRIGLRSFLFTRQVPEVNTPICRCGTARETPAHLAAYCPELHHERACLQKELYPRLMRTSSDFAIVSKEPRCVGVLVRWLLRLGRLPEYRKALVYTAQEEE
jgi:hypothetical protein